MAEKELKSIVFPGLDNVYTIPQGGITPTGTKNIRIEQNGTTVENVAGFANAQITVSVSGGGNVDFLRSWISGKKVSIIGDSIDSLNRPGYNPLNYPTYYPNRTIGVEQASDTWWYQVLVNSGASIEVNASSSGSMVTNNHSDPATRPDFYARTSLVGNPDIVFVTLGTNDSNIGVELGEYDYTTPYEQLSELIFRPAYIKGVKSLQALYPGVQIVCITELMKPEYKKSILDIANTLGCVFIDASGYDTSTDTKGIHPGKLGMMQIASHVLYPTDVSLTQEHIPADAKRTGEKLAILKKEAVDSNISFNALLTYLFDILRAAEYSTDKSAEIDALEEALELRTINADYSYGELTLDLFNSTPAWSVS